MKTLILDKLGIYGWQEQDENLVLASLLIRANYFLFLLRGIYLSAMRGSEDKKGGKNNLIR